MDSALHVYRAGSPLEMRFAAEGSSAALPVWCRSDSDRLSNRLESMQIRVHPYKFMFTLADIQRREKYPPFCISDFRLHISS